MSLEFVSTKDLIDEIQKRTTFAGIMIWSEEERKDHCVEDLKVFSTFNAKGTIKVLKMVEKEVDEHEL